MRENKKHNNYLINKNTQKSSKKAKKKKYFKARIEKIQQAIREPKQKTKL